MAVASVTGVNVVVHVHAVDHKQVLPAARAIDADVCRGKFTRGFAAQLTVIKLHVGVGAQQAGDVAITGRQAFYHLPVDGLLALKEGVHSGDGRAFDEQRIALRGWQNGRRIGCGCFP